MQANHRRLGCRVTDTIENRWAAIAEERKLKVVLTNCYFNFYCPSSPTLSDQLKANSVRSIFVKANFYGIRSQMKNACAWTGIVVISIVSTIQSGFFLCSTKFIRLVSRMMSNSYGVSVCTVLLDTIYSFAFDSLSAKISVWLELSIVWTCIAYTDEIPEADNTNRFATNASAEQVHSVLLLYAIWIQFALSLACRFFVTTTLLKWRMSVCVSVCDFSCSRRDMTKT